MPSKQVSDRAKADTSVRAALSENEKKIVEGVLKQLGLAPEVISALLQAMSSTLESATGTMVAADTAHMNELGDDAAPRVERDQQAERVADELSALRDAVTVAYGAPALRTLGFDGRTPVDPVQLQLLGSQVVENLGKWKAPGPSRLPGFELQPELWSAKLNAPLVSLSSALEAVAREKREADTTLVAKNRAIEDWDKTFSLTATILSALLELVGERELARRVRPSRRRPGMTQGQADEVTQVTEEPAPANG